MNNIRLIILIGQLGRIFGKSFAVRKYFSALVAIGFFTLFVKRQDEKEERYEERNIRKFVIFEEDELY